MKKRMMKIVCMMVMMCVLLAGCGNRYTDEEVAQMIEEAKSEALEMQADEEEESVSEERDVSTEADIKEDVSEADGKDTSKDKEQDASQGDLSQKWTDLQFVFDGKNYQIPFSYKDLEAEGWSFDLADYGYENGYILNPGDYVSGTIHLEKEGYERNEVDVAIGFINNASEAKDILECEVYSFTLQTNLWLIEDIKYPDMKIAKNIGIGSSYDDVKAAFGEPNEFYDDTDNECYYISYEVDYTYILDMTISKERGVSSICIENRDF